MDAVRAAILLHREQKW